MKDKLILFTIGILVGSIISTAICFTYLKSNNTREMNHQMSGRDMNFNNQDRSNTEPPEIPNNNQNNNTQNNS